MKFVRLYIHLPTESLLCCHDQDFPHSVEMFRGPDIYAICFGAIESALCPDESVHQFLMSALEVVPGSPLKVRFKNPAHEQFLHRCPTMADALQSGDHDLPEPVKAHLRGRWAHRDDLPLKAFRNIGFTYAEIRALAKFQLLQHRQRESIERQKQGDIEAKKASAADARLARTLEKKRVK